MILCICNNISEHDIKKNPELAILIGSCCGKCTAELKIKVPKDSE
jgi:bacterioferritin-associated ferredoxin